MRMGMARVSVWRPIEVHQHTDLIDLKAEVLIAPRDVHDVAVDFGIDGKGQVLQRVPVTIKHGDALTDLYDPTFKREQIFGTKG